MTVRYRREGLRIVRVDGGPSAPAAEEVVADQADDLAVRLHRFATALRRDAARYRPLRETEAPSDVTKEELRRARGVAGLTQKELAERLNFGRQHLSDMETGRRSVSWSVGEWARRVLLGQERG